ncbi:MAG: hypothetical protein QM655_00060 [Nocardioidaceae bacterium]
MADRDSERWFVADADGDTPVTTVTIGHKSACIGIGNSDAGCGPGSDEAGVARRRDKRGVAQGHRRRKVHGIIAAQAVVSGGVRGGSHEFGVELDDIELGPQLDEALPGRGVFLRGGPAESLGHGESRGGFDEGGTSGDQPVGAVPEFAAVRRGRLVHNQRDQG